jgi:hypothetical protein
MARGQWELPGSQYALEVHMMTYKVIPPRRYEPVAYLRAGDGNKPLDAAFAEFESTYGFNEHRTVRDLRKRNQAQVNLARDASFLGLEHNPLYDDLSLVFVDWAKKRYGYQQVTPDDIQSDNPEEFKFPY